MTDPLSHNRQSGFTLVELLVCLSLLGLLSVVMVTGYQTSVLAWKRVDARSEAQREAEAAEDLLRGLLSQIYPAVSGDDSETHVMEFDGDSQTIRFFSPLRQRFGATPIVRYRISAAENGAISLAWQLDGAGTTAEDQSSETILLHGLASIRFAYFGTGTAAEAPRWFDRWNGQKTLPQLIRIDLIWQDTRLANSEFVVAPLITGGNECAPDPVDAKCRSL
jgi:general secretion pathway protein J